MAWIRGKKIDALWSNENKSRTFTDGLMAHGESSKTTTTMPVLILQSLGQAQNKPTVTWMCVSKMEE